jgi:ribA/ribD-fused uncharacterized protein
MITIPYYETSNFCFSNFSAHAVEFNGIKYPTAEHAFHAQKFSNKEVCERIRNCGSPLAAWELAHELKPQRRQDWDDVKVEILTEIVRSKVSQHPEVKNALLATGSEDIVEVNPNDDFWGNGADGNGQNHTGKILMKIRKELAS